jgi:hypothetical protein
VSIPRERDVLWEVPRREHSRDVRQVLVESARDVRHVRRAGERERAPQRVDARHVRGRGVAVVVVQSRIVLVPRSPPARAFPLRAARQAPRARHAE